MCPCPAATPVMKGVLRDLMYTIPQGGAPPWTTLRLCRKAMPQATPCAAPQMADMSGGLLCLATPPSQSCTLNSPRSSASCESHATTAVLRIAMQCDVADHSAPTSAAVARLW